jgi:hypothetical protein
MGFSDKFRKAINQILFVPTEELERREKEYQDRRKLTKNQLRSMIIPHSRLKWLARLER